MEMGSIELDPISIDPNSMDQGPGLIEPISIDPSPGASAYGRMFRRRFLSLAQLRHI
jgi:hypothetical protein